MNINQEIKETVRPTYREALKEYFNLKENQSCTNEQINEIEKAFDKVYGILQIMDEKICVTDASRELNQMINVSKMLVEFISSPVQQENDFTGYEINTLTPYQLANKAK